MNLFKSVFSQDLDPEHDEDPNPNPNSTSGGWNLGGLMKSVASKSESVIKTYRRDLEEFGSGLKKETAVIREVAARSVDEIIKHGKEVLAVDSIDDAHGKSKRYTRLEAQIMAIQSDEGTFTTDPDPEDMKDFENWKIGFDLEEKKEEIEMLMYDNDMVESMSDKFIPHIVDYWTFWYRYFYRVYKVKQAEETRAELVKRVISRDDEEEELSWEVEDDEEIDEITGANGEKNSRGLDEIQNMEGTQVEMVKKEGDMKREEQNEDDPMEKKGGTSEIQEKDTIIPEPEPEPEPVPTKSAEVPNEVSTSAIVKDEKLNLKSEAEEEDTTIPELEPEPEPVPTKSGEVPNEVSTSAIVKDEKLNLKSEAEEDLEWDEIEDLGEGDNNNKPSGSIASPKLKEDLRKRLSVAEDDEDLTWDIEEDDDDHVPANK
ncbi:BSD domain-containing protein 1-like protein [Carex littledalei]|uniref:BSD domain-containing protein 1-like protein n=1 Tax=Carex littledalei TaxID=544730 RepID=A0A833RK04_9POAL|nr:BSD domain-containing protein 1-like protein [Carex littledalei]